MGQGVREWANAAHLDGRKEILLCKRPWHRSSVSSRSSHFPRCCEKTKALSAFALGMRMSKACSMYTRCGAVAVRVADARNRCSREQTNECEGARTNPPSINQSGTPVLGLTLVASKAPAR